jgi:hypothetical protein
MKTLPLSKLKAHYEYVCAEYVFKFCNKQGLEFDGWVGDDVGGVAACGDYFFNLSDIVLDINNKCRKGLILDWQNDSVEAHMGNPSAESINYYSYSKGLRYEDLKPAAPPEK